MTRRCLVVALAIIVLASPQFARGDEQSAISEIEKLGGSVRKIAANSPSREIDFHLTGTDLTDDGIVHVAAVGNLVWLHLKDTKITDGGLQHLAGLSQLTRLHLEKTGIGDEGLKHLAGLSNLEYLNLYGTKVTNAGLAHLKPLKKLRKLYLWQTEVTEEGVAELKKALPELSIVLGTSLVAAKPTDAKPDPKPAASDKPPAKTLAKGQFVRVRLEGGGRILSLAAQVEVLETGSGKVLQTAGKATQSSVASAGDAARGHDGNTNQVYTSNSVTHTNTEDNPWWMLDLGGAKDIGRVKVWNRGDCCGDRLNGAIIEVLDPAKKVVWTSKVEQSADGKVHAFDSK